MLWTVAFLLWTSVPVSVCGLSDPNAPDSCAAAVLRVRAVAADGTLYCDIADFPAVVGVNMPVRLRDLQPAAETADNQPMRAFLSDLLIGRDKPPHIRLRNLARGERFYLLADIDCDGVDLGRQLVDRGLARRILQVGPDRPPTKNDQTNPIFMGTKTSKHLQNNN